MNGTMQTMSADSELVAMNVRLTPEARDGLHDYAARYGATLTSLMEALGQWASEHEEGRPTAGEWRDVAAYARSLDLERRRRTVRRGSTN